MSLATLLNQRVGLQFEMMAEPDAQALAELLVAFANSDGGTVLMGVTPEGRITGELLVEDVENALRQAATRCEPVVKPDWQQFEDRAGLVIALGVTRSATLHSLQDGRVLRRTHNGNEVVVGQQIAQLLATRSMGDFEQEIVAGASRRDLDDDVIDYYLDRRKRRVARDARMTDDEILQGIGVLTPDGRVTVAGMVLFGKDPQFYLPQTGLTYVRYAGAERMAAPGQPRYLDREEIDGPLAHVLESTWRLLWRELRGPAVVRGLVRHEEYLLPQDAVREALVNAMCHRDYSLKRRVEVSRFDNRLEISSPGGLAGWITIDNIFDEHYARNPRIVNALFEWQYIEHLGLGMRQMARVMTDAGHPIPLLIPKPESFTVILRQGSGIPAVPIAMTAEAREGLNERQIRALQYLAQNGKITNSTMRDLIPDVTAETLRTDLADLVDRGVIVRIGDKRGTYYILKQTG